MDLDKEEVSVVAQVAAEWDSVFAEVPLPGLTSEGEEADCRDAATAQASVPGGRFLSAALFRNAGSRL
jgi:hypothetical protein